MSSRHFRWSSVIVQLQPSIGQSSAFVKTLNMNIKSVIFLVCLAVWTVQADKEEKVEDLSAPIEATKDDDASVEVIFKAKSVDDEEVPEGKIIVDLEEVSQLTQEHRDDGFGIELDETTAPKPRPRPIRPPQHRPRRPLGFQKPRKPHRAPPRPKKTPQGFHLKKRPFLKKPLRPQFPHKALRHGQRPPLRRDLHAPAPHQLTYEPPRPQSQSYGAPAVSHPAPSYHAPAQPQIIIKQAGPSKQFGWVGHGKYAPLNIPNPFPRNLPKWHPMDGIFEAGLLYPGNDKAPSYAQPRPVAPAPSPYSPPSKSHASSNTYTVPAAPASTSYSSSSATSSNGYSAPVPASTSYSSSATSSNGYSAPVPASTSYSSSSSSSNSHSSSGSSSHAIPAPASNSYSAAAPASNSYSAAAPASSSYSSSGSPSPSFSVPAPASSSYSSSGPVSTSYSVGAPASNSYSSSGPASTSYSAGAPAPASNSYSSAAPVSSSYSPAASAPASNSHSSSGPVSNSYSASAPTSNTYSAAAPVSNNYGAAAPASNSYSSSAPASNSYSSSAPASSSYSGGGAPAASNSFSSSSSVSNSYSAAAPASDSYSSGGSSQSSSLFKASAPASSSYSSSQGFKPSSSSSGSTYSSPSSSSSSVGSSYTVGAESSPVSSSNSYASVSAGSAPSTIQSTSGSSSVSSYSSPNAVAPSPVYTASAPATPAYPSGQASTTSYDGPASGSVAPFNAASLPSSFKITDEVSPVASLPGGNAQDQPPPVYTPAGKIQSTNYDKIPTRVFDPATESFITVGGKKRNANPFLLDTLIKPSVTRDKYQTNFLAKGSFLKNPITTEEEQEEILELEGFSETPEEVQDLEGYPETPQVVLNLGSFNEQEEVLDLDDFSEPEVVLDFDSFSKPEGVLDLENFSAPNVDLDLESFSEPEVVLELESSSEPDVVVGTKGEIFEVPLKVEELAGQGQVFIGQDAVVSEGEEPEVFYIFYENEDDRAPVEVYAANPQVDVDLVDLVQQTSASDQDVQFVVEEPVDSQFSPPAEDEIRTIYVPVENAINIPSNFDVNIGTSFGLGAKKRKQQPPLGFPNFPGGVKLAQPPSYDNPISSYDAPIYNDNSYTAPVEEEQVVDLFGTIYEQETNPTAPSPTRKPRRTVKRKVRRPAPIDDSVQQENESSELYLEEQEQLEGSLPYGARISKRKPYRF
eukprot:maker-scaffold412_size179788-snap-gene-0.20 protein:Tk11833 transcript:maker-scaffold412_size179788-snap-gene-0.20-mRNA-1 annotation:"kxy xw signal peptide domain protein"